MMYLIYTSEATQPASDADLVELLRQSKTNNTKTGITGLLLYRDGLYMQLLEGPDEAVRECFERIGLDPRHRDILKLMERSSDVRLFENWAMAFQNVGTVPDDRGSEGFSSFLSEPFSPYDLGSELNEALYLLLSFKKGIPLAR